MKAKNIVKRIELYIIMLGTLLLLLGKKLKNRKINMAMNSAKAKLSFPKK